jgi:hypothetical protein
MQYEVAPPEGTQLQQRQRRNAGDNRAATARANTKAPGVDRDTPLNVSLGGAETKAQIMIKYGPILIVTQNKLKVISHLRYDTLNLQIGLQDLAN